MFSVAKAAAACMVSMQLGTNPATTPVPRLDADWWKARHEERVAFTQSGSATIVFLGDSITQGWESTGLATWNAQLAPLGAANFGFSGDRTEHVLWRLQNGEIVKLQPKVIVLLIGTNNVGHGISTPSQSAEGVHAILAYIKTSMPRTRVALMGLLPRDLLPTDEMRRKADAITGEIQKFADGHRVVYVDVGQFFLHRDGSLRETLLPDRLHLNAGGYEIWAQAIVPTLKDLLANPLPPSF